MPRPGYQPGRVDQARAFERCATGGDTAIQCHALAQHDIRLHPSVNRFRIQTGKGTMGFAPSRLSVSCAWPRETVTL